MRTRSDCKVDVPAAIKAKLAGASYRDIAKAQGATSHQAIHKAIAPILAKIPGAEDLADYKQHSADMFHLTAMRMISSIDDDDIKKVPADKRVLAAAVATDKARLISGQSTSNAAIICSDAAAIGWDDQARPLDIVEDAGIIDAASEPVA